MKRLVNLLTALTQALILISVFTFVGSMITILYAKIKLWIWLFIILATITLYKEN